MALPTASDLKAVAFAKAGAPFIRVASKASISLDALDFGYGGGPFWGLGGAAPPAPSARKSMVFVIIT